MNAAKMIQKANMELDAGRITLGEYEKRIEPFKDVESVVRCVDCEEVYFAGNRVPSEQSLVCGRYGMDVKDNFFCANGVRKVREDYMG